MTRNALKRTAQTVAAVIVLALLVASAIYYSYDSSRASSDQNGEVVTLKIAYLPITHALPLFKAKEDLEASNSNVRVELVKYGSWNELSDAINAGRVDGASMLIELAMKAREQGIDLKMEALGHRDGNVVVGAADIQSAADLRGKTVAIPSKLSSHNILMRQYLVAGGVDPSEVNFVEMTPTEMPSALQSGQIAGYCVAEPFGAKAITLGTGHVLSESGSLWPDSVCCGIVVNADATADKQAAVDAFVDAYKQAGTELDADHDDELRIAVDYLGQDEETAKTSIQWINFSNLDVSRDAYDDLSREIVDNGLPNTPPSYDDFVAQQN